MAALAPQAPDAGRLTYVLRQRFSYSYDAPVRDLDHRLVVVPPRQHGDQRRGPAPDMIVPTAALTDSRLLRPTRLTAADAAIRRLAATMAGQDKLATADRFCAYGPGGIPYPHGG